MKNRMRLAAAALALSTTGFGLTGRDGETKETVAKTEAADKQAGGAQAADTQANGDQAEGGQEEGSRTTDGERYKVALRLSDAANDTGWCQSAYDSLKFLEADYGCEVTYTENLTPDDIEATFADYAANGHDVVTGHGYEFGGPAMDVAEQYPDTKFIVTEGEVPTDNVASYASKCEEGGYIVGMLAADMSEGGKASFVGLIQGVSLVKITNGLRDGVKKANPDIQIQIAQTGSFTDMASDKEAAQVMIDNGVDVIGHRVNESGTGAINAAKEVKVYATSDSYDQNDLVPDTILSSSVYHTPHVVEVAFKTVADGTFEDGINQLGMTDGAVSVAPYHNPDSAVPDGLKQKISGKIVAIESGTFEVTCDIKPRI